MSTPNLTRREFLAGAMAAAAGLLAGCGQIQTPAAIRRPEIIHFYPDAPSRVVHTHHPTVWTGEPQGRLGDDDLLSTPALREMLDASIVALTGLDDAHQAWAALFSPDERIAIKVCTFGCGRGSTEISTHVPLALAIADCLQDVGVPAEQITIFDRNNAELKGGGFTINRNKPGVRCHGTGYTAGWQLMGEGIKLADVLLECDALINVPLLKAHGIGGMTFAMKSHYGTFNRPQDFHQGKIGTAIAELNALEPIKNRTRLIVGDVLVASTSAHASAPYWTLDVVGDSILMSFDPVAHDTVGLQVLHQFIDARSGYKPATNMAKQWLKKAADLDVGTNDPAQIDLIEVNLG